MTEENQTQVGGVDSKQLNSYFDRIENIEEEIKALRADLREIYAEAKGNGYDPKVMRQVLRLRKMTPADRAETEFLLESYKAAVGMD